MLFHMILMQAFSLKILELTPLHDPIPRFLVIYFFRFNIAIFLARELFSLESLIRVIDASQATI